MRLGKCDNLFTFNLKTLGLNNFKGTLPYMSPEILEEKEATIYSDIWALASTIVEIYQEKVLWKISTVLDLSLKFSKKQMPDLRNSSIPTPLINILSECFDYVPEKRPQARELLKSFKELTKIKV